LKISILIPAYNRELYIGRCIRSLLDQSFDRSQYEIIIINDGSDDLTSFAVSQFVSPFEENLIVINRDKNMGLPYSLNEGLKIARGEYFVRVDSDDYVNRDFLRVLYLAISLNQFDAVACDYYKVDEAENFLERFNCIDYPIACGVIFRKDAVLSLGGYDPSFLMHEDQELMFRFKQVFTVNGIPFPLYRYRIHDENMTKNQKLSDKFERLLEVNKSKNSGDVD